MLKIKVYDDHGVGAKHIGRHVIIVQTDAVSPNPAKQVQIAGGNPKVKQPPAAPNPAPAKVPEAPMQAAHAAGPDCTLVRQARMIRIIISEAEFLDI